jgi:gamma-D-glutamyl-L-lysine dipeptidyl-peptidase
MTNAKLSPWPASVTEGPARVRAAVAPLLAEPRIASVLTSQLASGRVVDILQRSGDWVEVRGDDAYVGWMHTGYLEATRGDEDDWPMSTGGTVREPDGRVRALPFGARVAPEAMVLTGETFDDDERLRCFPALPDALVHSAERFFTGASYLWGGTTPWGCDCSGFVQAVARLHDVPLPRDAWQQAEQGAALIGATVHDVAWQPADLLFFSDRDDRRITHVGLSLGDARLMHSALGRGGVTVESLLGDDPYVERLRRQFVTGRRVLAPPAVS